MKNNLSTGTEAPAAIGQKNKPHENSNLKAPRSPFGEYIRKRRLSLRTSGGVGATLRQLAEHSGLSYRSLRRWESGDAHPTASRGSRWADHAETLRNVLGLPEGEYYDLLEKSRIEWGGVRQRFLNQTNGTRIFNLRLHKDAKLWVEEQAAEQGISVSEFVNRIFIEQQQNGHLPVH